MINLKFLFFMRFVNFTFYNFLILLVVMSSAFAAEISTSPLVKYEFSGDLIFPSISDFVSNRNEADRIKFDKCMASPNPVTGQLSCTLFTIENVIPHPELQAKYNGMSSYHLLQRSQAYYSRLTANDPITISEKDAGGFTIATRLACPDTFKRIVSGVHPDFTMVCKKIELQSCPVDGNPINIGTGEKIEQAVDFITADGLLKVERRYINQFTGWGVEEPREPLKNSQLFGKIAQFQPTGEPHEPIDLCRSRICH